MLSTDKMKTNSTATYNVCHLKNQHLSVLSHSFNCGPTQFPRMQHLDWKQLLLYLPLCGICWQILILEWQHLYSVFIQVCQDKQPLIHVDKESLKMFCCSFQHAVTTSLLVLIQAQPEIQSIFLRATTSRKPDHFTAPFSNFQERTRETIFFYFFVYFPKKQSTIWFWVESEVLKITTPSKLFSSILVWF